MTMPNLRHLSRLCIVFAVATLLAACGFQLRGKEDLAFDTLYVQGANLSISKQLKRQLEINGVEIVTNPEKAELVLELMSEDTEQEILSLSGEGVVREYELFYRVHFRLRNPASETWGPVQIIENRRDFTYDDTQLLAKQFEREQIYNDMRSDATRELLRRLVVQKPEQIRPAGS